MNNSFPSHRWFGRLIGVLLSIAKRKNVRFDSQQKVTFLDLYIKSITVATEKEKKIINQLRDNWERTQKEETAQSVVISNADACQEKGRLEASYVWRDTSSYEGLLDDVDYYELEQKRIQLIQQKKQKRKRITYLAIAAVILAMFIYNLPICKEFRAYKEVVREGTVFECEWYYSLYPNGRHYGEVLYIESTISDSPIKPITTYLSRYPDGKYAEVLNERYNALWDEQIAIYKNRDKSGDDPSAVAFMEALLYHMKTNRINTILMNLQPEVSLKDYGEYDESIRMALEESFQGESLSLKGNIVSLKDNFKKDDEAVLGEILSEGIKQSFERLFSSDFINIELLRGQNNPMCPMLTIEYKVSNKEEFDLYMENDELRVISWPDIWVYSSNNVPQAYILAIDVRFSVNFSIAGVDAIYEYSDIGAPANEISGISSIKDGYRMMTQMCFAKFSNKIAENLGLEASYFRGE